jgi:engulfment/cell motility protein 1
MRLDRNLKVIHFCDSAVKFPVRSGLEDLPERIDVSMIGEIAINTCAMPQGVNIAAGPIGVGGGQMQSMALHDMGALTASPISFSLLSVKGGEALGDHVATDPSRWADWTDGLNMLRRDGGHVATGETAGFVHSLTEIGLKIKLLGECRPAEITLDVQYLLRRSVWRESRYSLVVNARISSS